MKTHITISIEIEHLNLIDKALTKNEARSHFLIKAALKEAMNKQPKKEDD